MKQPATPLPWKHESKEAVRLRGKDRTTVCIMHQIGIIRRKENNHCDDDAAYIVEACNAYPRLIEEREKLIGALQAITKVAGNLSDDKLEGGISNDAKMRGLMVINARDIAEATLALIECSDGQVTTLASLEKDNG